MQLPKKDKPLSAWHSIKKSPALKATVRSVLDELKQVPEAIDGGLDGAGYDAALKKWIADHKPTDPRYMGN